MNLAIVPDFKVMTAIRYKGSSFDTAEVSRKSFEYAFDVSVNCDSKLILAKQILDELKFNDEQRTAMEPFCEFDKTTQGVQNYDAKNCIVETTNTWIIKTKVLVLTDGSLKQDFKEHENLFVLHPDEFNNIYEMSQKLKEKVDATQIQIILFLLYELKKQKLQPNH